MDRRKEERDEKTPEAREHERKHKKGTANGHEVSGMGLTCREGWKKKREGDIEDGRQIKRIRPLYTLRVLVKSRRNE